MFATNSSKCLFVFLLLPAILLVSMMELCFCAPSHGHEMASPFVIKGQEHHHEHTHHDDCGKGCNHEESHDHEKGHTPLPIVQVERAQQVILPPLLMILVEYFGFVSKLEIIEDIEFIDTSPPIAPRVLIEPYRPMLH